MGDPIKFIFEVKTTSGNWDVVGYQPYEGAEFCAHRHLEEPLLWNVAHARTSLKLPIESYGTFGEALDIADKLSRRCPSAREIEWDRSSMEGDLGIATGPIKKLAGEVRSVLAEAA